MMMVVMDVNMLGPGLLLPRLAPKQGSDAVGNETAKSVQRLAEQVADAAEDTADDCPGGFVQPEEAELAGEHEVETIGDDQQNHHVIEVSR